MWEPMRAPSTVSIFSMKQEARSSAEMRLVEKVLENEFVIWDNGKVDGLANVVYMLRPTYSHFP